MEAAVAHGLVDPETLRERLEETALEDEMRRAVTARIGRLARAHT